MKIYENGIYRDMTPEETARLATETARATQIYWQTASYNEAVNTEIRKRYTVSEEFAVLRQREEKPAEYADYFAYCEQCKAYVRDQKARYAKEENT